MELTPPQLLEDLFNEPLVVAGTQGVWHAPGMAPP